MNRATHLMQLIKRKAIDNERIGYPHIKKASRITFPLLIRLTARHTFIVLRSEQPGVCIFCGPIYYMGRQKIHR